MSSDIVVGSALVHGADARSVYQGDPSARAQAAGLRDGVSQSHGGMDYIGNKPKCRGLDGKGLTKSGNVCVATPGATGFCFGHIRSTYARSILSESGA